MINNHAVQISGVNLKLPDFSRNNTGLSVFAPKLPPYPQKTDLDVVTDRASTQYQQYRRNGQGEVVSDFMVAPRTDDAAEQKGLHHAAEQPHFGFIDADVWQAGMVGFGVIQGA